MIQCWGLRMTEKFILSYKLPPALAGGKKEFQYQQALAKFCLQHLHPDDSMLQNQNVLNSQPLYCLFRFGQNERGGTISESKPYR